MEEEVGVLQVLPMFIRPGLVFLLFGCCLAKFAQFKKSADREERLDCIERWMVSMRCKYGSLWYATKKSMKLTAIFIALVALVALYVKVDKFVDKLNGSLQGQAESKKGGEGRPGGR